MGGVSGVFHPTDAYQRIQPVIWNTIRYSDYTNSSTPEGIATFRAKDALALRVCTEAGESLEQVGPIWLADFTDQFSDIEIELDVAGVPWWVLKRVFGWVEARGLNKLCS